MNYAYARVSTAGQNLSRQIEEFKKYEIDRLYCEKESGKSFKNRAEYLKLRKSIKSGDTLYIMSIDRLGRNYQQILEEWQYLTTKKNADIIVCDMPILSTKNNVEGLDGRFISQLVLQILAYVAEKEREKIKERQAQGIQIAMANGVKFGRPKKDVPSNSNEIIQKYLNREITNIQASQMIGVAKGQFFRLVREYAPNREKLSPIKREKSNSEKIIENIKITPKEISEEDKVLIAYQTGEISAEEGGKKLNLNRMSFIQLAMKNGYGRRQKEDKQYE